MLKRILKRMGGMCRPAWYIFSRCFALAGFLLGCGLLLTVCDPAAPQYLTARKTAYAIFETAQAVLLIGILFSAIVEDQQSRR